MPTIAMKLDRFKAEIMSDVADRKSSIETKLKKRLDKEYHDREVEYLEEAYEIIEKGLKRIDKEKNEIISKVSMENRVKLLAKRKEIMDEVWIRIIKKISDYTKTEKYKKQLIAMIESDMEFIGDGDYIIYLNNADEWLREDVQQAFPKATVELEDKRIEMLGGCKLHNITKSTFLDDTFAKKLEKEEEYFLQNCGIEIDEK